MFSPKEIKSLLKEARELIKNKEYQFAIRKCNDIVKYDKKNGMAYILLGAAYQESSKNLAADNLKLALNCGDEFKQVALQGLSNCASVNELADIYEKLLNLTPDKYSEIYTKLNNLQQDDPEVVIKIFCKEVKTEDPDRKYLALKMLLNMFLKNKVLALNKYSDIFLESLEIGIQDRQHLQHIDIYQNYFQLLYVKKNNFEVLLKAAEEMSIIYTNNISPLEWICKVYVENQESGSFSINMNLKSNFGIYVEKLLELNSNSVLGLMASGLVKYAIGDLIGARDVLLKVNMLKPNWNICLKTLATIHMKLRAFLLAELVLRQMKDSDLLLAECLIEQALYDQLNEAIKICRDILTKRDDEEVQFKALKLISTALIYSHHFESAAKSIEELKSLNATLDETNIMQSKMYRLQGEPQKAIDLLTSNRVETHESFLELGKCQFDLKNYDDSLLNILKATKLESHNSECFYLLGKIYTSINDEVRGRKCLEKCLNLNPQNEKSITILSSVYRRNNEWELNLALLQNSLKSVDGVNQKTSFLHLGLHHLAQFNYDDAITAFRSALKHDSDNVECWEGLADAYLARGSYSSAQKVFQKNVQLDKNNFYAKLQIARIKYILQQYIESIEDYQQLLQDLPDYLPALKGIAESHLGKAYYLLEKRLIGRARVHAQDSLNYLQKAISIEPNFLCLWRMLANVLDFGARLPNKYSKFLVSGNLICEKIDSKNISGEELYELAAKCYSRCLKLKKDDDLVWFEMSSNYYFRSVQYYHGSARKEYLELAFESAKHLVKLCGTRWQNWNLLGIIATTKEIDDPALAQHAFIKAVNLDKKSFTSWCNLGVFYLIEGNVSLANKAFSRAQQTDTTFINAWIGQATIAEMIGDRDEAMDLFRHCTQLGFHMESSIGYSNFVCSVLNVDDYSQDPKYEYAIDKMHAIPLALDSINWHCVDDSDTTFEAHSFLGYLNGCQDLWKESIKAYKKAVEKTNVKNKDKCLIDLGFSLLRKQNYVEAADVFQSVVETTFYSQIGLALAYVKAEIYEESYKIYEKAIGLAGDSSEQVQVLVAMSAMLYAFKGEEDAKVLLYQSISLPEGIFALCSLGLLHGDEQVGELAVKELRNYEGDDYYAHHVAYLIAQFFIRKNKKVEALSFVLSRIHEYPDRPLLRKVYADVVMQDFKDENIFRKAACRMAESSLVLQFSNNKIKICADEASKTLALASAAMESVDANVCKALAQKAVHLNPMCWNILKMN
ncbi:unnamed protein product [Diamesa serratosioi]